MKIELFCGPTKGQKCCSACVNCWQICYTSFKTFKNQEIKQNERKIKKEIEGSWKEFGRKWEGSDFFKERTRKYFEW